MSNFDNVLCKHRSRETRCKRDECELIFQNNPLEMMVDFKYDVGMLLKKTKEKKTKEMSPAQISELINSFQSIGNLLL
jgi:hypothetical protein